LKEGIREEGGEIVETVVTEGTREALDMAAGGAASRATGIRTLRRGRTTSKARYIYDPGVRRYRDTQTGRFVAQRDLPYPPNRGFTSSVRGTMKKGMIVERYGSSSGRYAGEPGVMVSELGLPPGSEALPHARYRVRKPFEAEIGPAAPVPDFAATGGATQYRFDVPVEELVKQGYLELVP
jgi:hypothetical protein